MATRTHGPPSTSLLSSWAVCNPSKPSEVLLGVSCSPLEPSEVLLGPLAVLSSIHKSSWGLLQSFQPFRNPPGPCAVLTSLHKSTWDLLQSFQAFRNPLGASCSPPESAAVCVTRQQGGGGGGGYDVILDAGRKR
ncbi:uncharacterized protein LOC123511987 isoform X1 [Portunus trituberculatus]|uniref:uncharacterized protein LOC123511987 isoform X1 n=1 Tax=Portunus trituberculatus TaxID=210409 RepID=UPI001E1D1AFB|nr:uncharacterized protein LOC123511987 isoform X1 [Portunus trituberculatus]